MKKFSFINKIVTSVIFSTICMFNVTSKTFAEEAKETPKDTELVFIVDKSGSMHHLTDDTIGNFNSVIDEQKNSDKKDNVYVTTVMFNDQHNKVHDRKDLKEIEHITKSDYVARGCTALLDAVGDTVSELSEKDELKDHKFLFVIITDGYENASKKYNADQVKKLIEDKKKDNWEFIFLGANIDTVKMSGSIGISSQYSRDYDATSKGLKDAYSRVSGSISQLRNGKNIDLDEALKDANKK